MDDGAGTDPWQPLSLHPCLAIYIPYCCKIPDFGRTNVNVKTVPDALPEALHSGEVRSAVNDGLEKPICAGGGQFVNLNASQGH